MIIDYSNQYDYIENDFVGCASVEGGIWINIFVQTLLLAPEKQVPNTK